MSRTTRPDGSRTYTVPDGQSGTLELPSVTTVLGVIAKPALTTWAANQTARYAVDNWTEIHSLITRGDPDGAYDLLKRAPWRNRDRKAERGTSVHDLVEQIILGGDNVGVAPDQLPYVEAFRQFVSDFPGGEFEASEMTVFNLSHGYAGTLDALFRFDGRLGALDWKTRAGKKKGDVSAYETELMQVAAYCRAEFVLLPDGSFERLPRVDGGSVVLLCDDGYRLVRVDVDDGFDGFIKALRLFLWRGGQGGR